MGLVTDIKYASMLGSYVRNYRRKSNNIYNFSCPICGDSTKNRTKARGYLYQKNSALRYKCHNCDSQMRIDELLSIVDGNLKDEYDRDAYLDYQHNLPTPQPTFEQPKFDRQVDDQLIKIADLADDHFAKQYVSNRKIPVAWYERLFFVPLFKQWANTVVANTFPTTTMDESRLIIPLLSRQRTVLGYQGRSLSANSKIKYITILVDPDAPKIFNLDRVNINQPIQAVEGPIDAMFLPNAVASAGGRIDTILPLVGIPKDRTVVVYDNEPRNIHTVKKMEKTINDGWSVCVWPTSIHHRDINDMILHGGMSPDDITDVINNNSYRDLQAFAELMAWRKV